MSWSGGLQEVLSLLEEINEQLGMAKEKTQDLQETIPDVEKQGLTLQQATRMLFRFNHVLAHMGLSQNVDAAIGQLQKLVFMGRMGEMSFRWLFMMPFSWYGGAMAIMGLASIGFTGASMKLQDDPLTMGE
jgi:hypothetical protein